MTYDKLVNGLMNKWGYAKFVRVIASGIIGAGVTALIVETITPDEPVNTETELIEKKENN